MPKKRVVKPQREFTKRQITRWQRQKRIQRIITGLFILVIVAVCGIMVAGWYTNDYRPLHQVVIRVNNTEFNMDYYVKMLQYYGRSVSSSYLRLLADNIVQSIQQSELIRQEAMKPTIGISVSDDEVNEKLKSYDPPLSKDYRDVVRAELLINKLLDEYFEPQTPTSAEQRHVLAMFLESESLATDVQKGLEAGVNFTDYASKFTLEYLSKESKGDLGWHPKEVFSLLLDTQIPIEYAFDAEAGVLSPLLYDEEQMKDIGYWLIKVLERNEEGESHVQAMLLGSQDEAQKVRARLEAGEDFADLARELSQYEPAREAGGDMDWLSPEMVTDAFDAYAFDPETEIGTVSQPVKDDTVQTAGGYWLVKVVEIDNNRSIADDDRELLKYQALEDWIAALWDDPQNEVESYLDEEMKEWAIERAYRS